MSEIQDIFKIPLYKTTLSLDNRAIKSYCLSLSKKSKGVVHTNQGGWQSPSLSKNERPLQTLYTDIKSNANEFLKSLEYNGNVVLDNIWININGYKDFNVLHKHDHSLISGVYYVSTPKDCGGVVFTRPGVDSFTYNWNNSQINYNNYNSTLWRVPALSGHLYLFPSWLNHFVEPNLNKKEKRISISFNFALAAI